MIAGKKIVLVVTGGIAAYKVITLARLLGKAGADVRVAMTSVATEFVTPKTFSVLTKHEVLVDLFDEPNQADIKHIEWADWADLIVVAPATANFIGKMAQGVADDAASSMVMARHSPIVIAPAMNSNMYQNEAVQRNLKLLAADGVKIIAPATGQLAEGYAGTGRLPEPEKLFDEITMFLAQRTGRLVGKRVVVTAGGTQEAIDPVRYIGNHSSGKMGYALAQAAAEAGAQVELISTVDLPVPPTVKLIPVQSASEMFKALDERFEMLDILFMAAAVADYRIAKPADQKLKKHADHTGLTLELVENPDILATLGAKKTHQYLVGFAAETEHLMEHANAKLTKKHVDLLIANNVATPGVGFGSDQNEVTLLWPESEPEKLPVADKLTLARTVMDKVITQLKEQ
ncbi:phosphopantothenoylcysteine decarboxylase/phosphopantothenate--cysteine ligase [Weissella uvarum]|uniref:bifunctional phosphopantothenoylcysteine decarboxylase/phosphopantothenate--cysteine ligase CoaBC n=1 Tax=Weissella uvarum TaxID=1479233 RepID=UPI001961ABC1|nr:bifunctional phosphopantothenoylcysteine decarboxylase/phosphopantothenate--cysteine ligase CoaBC [Weissella uvarum]MBM7618109.1 phosphopantothenoylcysteine decarboxylase/phosphopantothenate--cysteine ligase [Weissella uvarum]MCM0595904.1 bifunctional phosphopantothenoylcysteine decarboxylase/phosphopantothenate--cysteine ligase CoaBC [Weissella uvarum]